MEKRIVTAEKIRSFRAHLAEAEKSALTIEKYIRDVKRFRQFAGASEVKKDMVMAYKRRLMAEGYSVRSINSMLSSINSLFSFLNWQDCRVKSMRLQKQIYCTEDKELKKAEYMKLLEAAKGDTRMHMILQTLCGTGIRISELAYFTVEAAEKGEAIVSCKNKTRVILIPGKLRKLLLAYCKREGIEAGVIFRTKSGRPVDRSNVWRKMKELCTLAGVNPEKVFPHNLRKLFARTFYRMEKDIAKLADLLGHSSINTTRIYIMTSECEHRRKIERLGLVV